jgi:YVTN family beta-propeller protein
LGAIDWELIERFEFMQNLLRFYFLAAFFAGSLVSFGQNPFLPDPNMPVGHLPDGRQSVPTGQILDPAGSSLHFRGRPVDLAMAPNGKTLYIKNADNLLVVEIPNWTLLQTTNYARGAGSMHGIAVSHDGAHVYATGVQNEFYEWTAVRHGMLTFSRNINLPTNCNPCGIAISADDKLAYVCFCRSNELGIINLATGNLEHEIAVGVAPWGVTLARDGKTAYVTDWGGRHPLKGDLVGNSMDTPIVVDDRGIAASGVVSVVDLQNNREAAEVPVGLHPSDLVLSRDGERLYVANANSDTVTTIDTRTKMAVETISTRPDPSLPFGSAANALALSHDNKTLYVANGGNNAIAVIELRNKNHANSVLRGFVPTDWYPGAILADSSDLYVASVKGQGSLNGNVYLLTGSASKIPIPSEKTLSGDSQRAMAADRVPEMLLERNASRSSEVPVPVPAHLGDPSVFKHVLYIIKENKTYDQILGDMPEGNGRRNLCIYPSYVSPNHHALAAQYVLLDNYYCNGVYSTDGHSWCTEANATDYWEKSLMTINRAGHQGIDPLIYSSSGFIWDNVLRHGLTFHNYGVMGATFPEPSGASWLEIYNDYTNHAGRIHFHSYMGVPPVLPKYSSTDVSGFNLRIPDQLRADGFLKEFNLAQSNRVWPAFNMFYLPDDHTAGATPGYPTARAEVADNDLALGRVVEAVTKSCFASNTVIFVIEDDPQSGYDHVDGHRSICLVISPYTKRRQTISRFYNQIGLIHTMEQIMGLPPMNQMDAIGPLMGDCFQSIPDFTPYTALKNNVALNDMNPGTLGSLSRKDRHWAVLSQKMDFSAPDLANDDTLNRIIWHSIKGDTRYPSEFVGTHGDNLKRLGLAASKNGQSDDDD